MELAGKVTMHYRMQFCCTGTGGLAAIRNSRLVVHRKAWCQFALLCHAQARPVGLSKSPIPPASRVSYSARMKSV